MSLLWSELKTKSEEMVLQGYHQGFQNLWRECPCILLAYEVCWGFFSNPVSYYRFFPYLLPRKGLLLRKDQMPHIPVYFQILRCGNNLLNSSSLTTVHFSQCFLLAATGNIPVLDPGNNGHAMVRPIH